MKWFVTFTALVVSATAFNYPGEGYKDGDRYFLFPGDGDDTIHLVDAQEPVDEMFLNDYVRSSANNAYWLFTRDNPTTAQVLVPGNHQSLLNSYIDFAKDIVITAHGWKGDGNNDMNKMLTDAFLLDGDVNVIVLDWSYLARKNYLTAKKGIPAVGKALGSFIDWIVSLGASYDKMHLVGFSLGGHLVGSAGRNTLKKIRRITGLDPAGPLWYKNENRMYSTDAQYVEIIHTSTLYGLNEVYGDADFFPNGGQSMPGCIILKACSHSRAYKYMAASVIYNHLAANECSNLKEMKQNKCSGSLNSMGNSDLSKTRPGVFRVNTKKYFPF